MFSSLNKADLLQLSLSKQTRLHTKTYNKKTKNKWLPALLHYILIFVVSCEWCSLHPLLFNCDTHTHAQSSREKAINVLCSFTTSLVCWTCPVLVVLCLLHPPCAPACIHSNTHTCTKYVSCCILATGKVIIERAKELACCRAADLIPAIQKEEGRDFHRVVQHSTPISMLLNVSFVFAKWAVLGLTRMSAILLFSIPQKLCVSVYRW